MDMVALIQQGTGAATSPVAAFQAAMPSDSRALVSEIASAPGLTEGERTQLVQAVAAVDAGNVSSAVRAEVMAQVSGLGFYLKHTGDQGLPKWSVMTGLRTYGLNIDGYGEKGGNSERMMQHVQAQLDNVAQGRGVSVRQVMSMVQQVQQAAPVAQQAVPVRAQPVQSYSPRGESVQVGADGGRVEKVA